MSKKKRLSRKRKRQMETSAWSMRDRDSNKNVLGREKRKGSEGRKGIKAKGIKWSKGMRRNTISDKGDPSGRERRKKSKEGSERKVEFEPMTSNEGISPKEDEPERMKGLRIRGRRMSRDNGVEKIRGE